MGLRLSGSFTTRWSPNLKKESVLRYFEYYWIVIFCFTTVNSCTSIWTCPSSCSISTYTWGPMETPQHFSPALRDCYPGNYNCSKLHYNISSCVVTLSTNCESSLSCLILICWLMFLLFSPSSSPSGCLSSLWHDRVLWVGHTSQHLLQQAHWHTRVAGRSSHDAKGERSSSHTPTTTVCKGHGVEQNWTLNPWKTRRVVSAHTATLQEKVVIRLLVMQTAIVGANMAQ